MGRRLVRCSSFSLAGTNSDSRGDAEDAFGGEGEHEAGDTAEDHADADECADDPDGAGRPGAPDHDGQNEGDDAVDQKPDCAVAGTKLEVLDELDDPVVWVLKAKMKWVMPLNTMAQPKTRVMARPETDGTRMAKSPATMRRMLRAMDQLMALGTSAVRVDGGVLMSVLRKS